MIGSSAARRRTGTTPHRHRLQSACRRRPSRMGGRPFVASTGLTTSASPAPTVANTLGLTCVTALTTCGGAGWSATAPWLLCASSTKSATMSAMVTSVPMKAPCVRHHGICWRRRLRCAAGRVAVVDERRMGTAALVVPPVAAGAGVGVCAGRGATAAPVPPALRRVDSAPGFAPPAGRRGDLPSPSPSRDPLELSYQRATVPACHAARHTSPRSRPIALIVSPRATGRASPSGSPRRARRAGATALGVATTKPARAGWGIAVACALETGKAVAHAGDRLDVAWAAGVALDLGAQAADVDPDEGDLVAIAGAPDTPPAVSRVRAPCRRAGPARVRACTRCG